MIFADTALEGSYIIKPEKLEDERGFLARTYCKREFAALRLQTEWVQCNISFNRSAGTLRGLHWQAAPHEEIKLVRCTRGAIFDVIVDLRRDSRTYRHWLGVELTDANHWMLYVPKGFAHGYLTLVENVEVFYQMSAFYRPESARGVRWDDPAFGIQWPSRPTIISSRDRAFPWIS